MVALKLRIWKRHVKSGRKLRQRALLRACPPSASWMVDAGWLEEEGIRVTITAEDASYNDM